MHCMIGNTEPFLYVNTSGLHGEEKWQKVMALKASALGLTETHADRNLQRRLDAIDDEYWHIWGSPVDSTAWEGVAVLLRKKVFWAAKPVVWKPTDACYRFWKEGRLMAAQAFFGTGSQSCFVYVLYGKPTARYDAAARKHLADMLQAVADDAAARGGVPVFAGGDLNSQPHETAAVQRLTKHGDWHDAWSWGDVDTRAISTCTTGKGSRIDCVLMNASAAGCVESYAVRLDGRFATHRPVCVNVRLPASRQYQRRVRSIQPLAGIPRPPPGHETKEVKMPAGFDEALLRQDAETALGIWCRIAEEELLSLKTASGGSEGTRGRGKIRLDAREVCPATVGDTAFTRTTRALLKAIRRCDEVAVAVGSSYRRDRTWEAVWAVSPFCGARGFEAG